jgi:hypothetical protein
MARFSGEEAAGGTTMKQFSRAAKVAALVMVIAVAAPSAAAQSSNDPKQWPTSFFDTLMKQNVAAAFRLLKEETFLGHQRAAALGPLEEAMNRAVQTYGTIVNYELAREAKVGQTMARLTYLVNHQALAVQYIMILYKAPRGWNLVHVDFKDQILQYDYR